MQILNNETMLRIRDKNLLDKLDNIEDKTNAIYEKVNKYGS